MLDIQRLSVRFNTPDGCVQAINDISLQLAAGDSLGIVGESGCGKSQTVLAILGLLADNSRVSGKILFQGQDLLQASERQLNRVRGAKIGMIFQDPMSALNPYLRIRTQMTEVLQQHRGCSERDALKTSIEMLETVQITDARNRIHRYPHEFSGGMRQRVMIAMALLTRPQLIIADEPTTALDVTVQAQIIALLDNLRREFRTALIMISHDLGVVAGLCEHVAVLYAGRIVESASVQGLFQNPQHPYTQGLLRATPQLDDDTSQVLRTIPGSPPDLLTLSEGCAFCPRCEQRIDACRSQRPELINSHGHACACLVNTAA